MFQFSDWFSCCSSGRCKRFQRWKCEKILHILSVGVLCTIFPGEKIQIFCNFHSTLIYSFVFMCAFLYNVHHICFYKVYICICCNLLKSKLGFIADLVNRMLRVVEVVTKVTSTIALVLLELFSHYLWK